MSTELNCAHDALEVKVEVAIVSLEVDAPSDVRLLKLKVVCPCEAKFAFSGLPVSTNPLEPHVSEDGLEVFLPVATGLPPPERVVRWIELGNRGENQT